MDRGQDFAAHTIERLRTTPQTGVLHRLSHVQWQDARAAALCMAMLALLVGIPPQAMAVTASAYWQNWDLARAIVLKADGKSGYVLDANGGAHSFGP